MIILVLMSCLKNNYTPISFLRNRHLKHIENPLLVCLYITKLFHFFDFCENWRVWFGLIIYKNITMDETLSRLIF